MLRWKGMTQSRGRDGTIHQKVLWESRWSLGLVFLPLTRASVADPICSLPHPVSRNGYVLV